MPRARGSSEAIMSKANHMSEADGSLKVLVCQVIDVPEAAGTVHLKLQSETIGVSKALTCQKNLVYQKLLTRQKLLASVNYFICQRLLGQVSQKLLVSNIIRVKCC